jgi:hypothetical protein
MKWAHIAQEVVPMLRQRFPINKRIGILGSSMDGVISLWTAWPYPQTFIWAASLSGTLGWGHLQAQNPTILESWLHRVPATGHFYVDSGGSLSAGSCPQILQGVWTQPYYRDSDNYCANLEFYGRLSPYIKDRLVYHWEPDAQHAEDACSRRLPLALSHFLAVPSGP